MRTSTSSTVGEERFGGEESAARAAPKPRASTGDGRRWGVRWILLAGLLLAAPVGAEEVPFGDYNVIADCCPYPDPRAIDAVDLDGDGDLDVLVASHTGDDESRIAWYANNGQGNFGPQRVITTQVEGAQSVHAADLDGDGDLDVISALFDEDKIAWYANDGQGNFGAQRVITTLANGADFVHAADLDGDGDLDVLSSAYSDRKVAWYENLDGQGAFGAARVIVASQANTQVLPRAADLDGDGDLDILAVSFDANYDDIIAWYANDGQGNFGSRRVITRQFGAIQSLHAVDLDGDGDLDVLSGAGTPQFNEIAWHENEDGLGGFGSKQIIDHQSATHHCSFPDLCDDIALHVADLDRDGDMDVLSTSSLPNPNGKGQGWYENLGQATFSPERVINTGWLPLADYIGPADLDGDGDMDVLVSSWDQYTIAWYKNFSTLGPTYPLTVSTIGSGWVESSPSGIYCGNDCNANYASGLEVTLYAYYEAARSTFSGWSGACTGTGACTVTMDAAKTVTATFTFNAALRITDVSQAEGNAGTTPFTFTVTLAPASSETVTVNYATANGTALAGSDYTAASGTLTFTPGQTSKTVTVNVAGNTVVEPNETFFVNLSAPSRATIADGKGLGTILNDDGPVLRITDVKQAEGNAGTTPFTFTVTLAPASTGTVTVNYATANGTALAGSDYTAASGTLTFTPGQTSKTVTVNVTGNTVAEPNESFFVNLSAATGATIIDPDSRGLGTILNDDGPVLRITDVSKAEGNAGTAPFTFTVTLAPASTGTVSVKYATANGTALAGSDYTAASGTLTFTPGQTSKTVTVNVAGNTVVEPNETFFVNLSAATGATIIDPDSRGLGTILNDDGPVLRITDVSKAEGNAGTTPFTFTVTLVPASASTVSVNYATANGTALAGSDYTAASGTLTFTPGQTSKTVTVNVAGDTVVEPNETFFVNLSAATGATIIDPNSRGLGTILNDDGPVLRITDVSKAEGNAGTTPFTFTVTLAPASASTVSVNYATANGTALAGSDYTAASGTLTFTPGQTSKTVTVNVAGNTVVEPNETFFVNLSAATGATIIDPDSRGLGTILNDDGPVLRITDVSKAEGNAGTTPFTFTVTLAPASASTVSVNYATANGTALAGSDYTAASGTLTFTPGQTSKTVTVNVTGNTVAEPNESFFVNLSAATGATIIDPDSRGLGTILNDD